MEVKVRNLDASTVKRIDELAKKKNMSREQFLRIYIENLSVHEQLKEQENRYARLLEKTLNVIEQNTKALNDMKEFLYELTEGDDEL